MHSGSETSSGYRRAGGLRAQKSKIFKQKPVRITIFYQFCVFYCFSVALTVSSSHCHRPSLSMIDLCLPSNLMGKSGELDRVFTFILYNNKAFSKNLCVLNTTRVTQLICWCLIFSSLTECNQGRNTRVQRSRIQNNPGLSAWAPGVLRDNKTLYQLHQCRRQNPPISASPGCPLGEIPALLQAVPWKFTVK